MDKKAIKEITELAEYLHLLTGKMLNASKGFTENDSGAWSDSRGNGYHSGTINNLAPEVSKGASRLRKITSSWS